MIVAELGQAHDGSLGIAHSFIEALRGSGVAAIKVQVHIAEAESSALEPFRTAFSYEDPSRQAYWQRVSFEEAQWAELRAHCHEAGMKFFASAFSIEAVELLERIGVDAYKVGSGEVRNALLLDTIALTGRPTMVSSGMSSWVELDAALERLASVGSLTPMQCTTAYPTAPGQWGLGLLKEMRERYGDPVGYSDHSGSTTAGIAALALGASIVECHVTFDRRMFGPDSVASLTIDEVIQMAQAEREIQLSLQSAERSEMDVSLRMMFGKSLTVRRDLLAGHVLVPGDLETTKPAGQGMAAESYQKAIGRVLARPVTARTFLRPEDLV